MIYSTWFAPSSAVGRPVRTWVVRLANRLLRMLPADWPTVNYDVEGFSLRIPLNHPLPRVLATEERYLRPLRLLGEAVSAWYGDSPAIDVGANVGDTAVILAQSGCPTVVCVEGNDSFLPILRENAERALRRGWSFEIVDKFVAVDDNAQTASVETKFGTSRLVADSSTSTHEKIETIRPERLLSSVISVLKIDTDGMDLEILRAFVEADDDQKIRSVFVEFTPAFESIGSTTETLANAGLNTLYWFDHLGRLVCVTDAADHESARSLARYAEMTDGYYDIAAVRSGTPEAESFKTLVNLKA